MTFIKWTISIFAIFLLVLFFYKYILLRSENELDRASDQFVSANYDLAEKILKNLHNKISSSEYYLYQAYIKREKGSIETSNKYLKKAEMALDSLNQMGRNSSRIALEIYLNALYNAFLQDNVLLMSDLLKKAILIRKNNIWVDFFQTLHAYLNKNYSMALEEWQEQAHIGYLSPWMKKTFGDRFDAFWYSIHLCRAKIATGNYIEARERLTHLQLNASLEQIYEINLLMGLSYLKEGEENSIHTSTPYYKKAIYFLSQVPLHINSYHEEFLEIQNILKNLTTNLIINQTFTDISFYTNVMKKWSQKSDLNYLNTELHKALNQKILECDWASMKALAKALRHVIVNYQQNHELYIKFENLFNEALNNGSMVEMEHYLEVLCIYSSQTKETNNTIAYRIENFIYEIISIDSETLHLTIPYLDLWMKLDSGRSHRYVFASLILKLAEELWSIGQTTKALELFKLTILLPYPADQSCIRENVKFVINYLIKKMETVKNDSHLHSLNYILKEINQVNENSTPQKKSEAERLFEIKQYDEAKEEALDSIKEEPDNQKSLTILGLIEFYKGNYNSAKNYFNEINSPNNIILKTKAISEILCGDDSKGIAIFDSLSPLFSINNEDYKRLGFGYLQKKLPLKSLECFSKISPTPPDVTAGKTLAYFLSNQYEEALKEYNNLPKYYKVLPGIQRVLLESTAALGDFQACDTFLTQLFHKVKQPLSSIYSSTFLDYKCHFLDYQTPDYVAGMFYYTWRNDTPKALKHLRNITDPHPAISLTIGKILSKEKKYQEAYDVLIKAFPLEKNQDFENDLIEEAVLLLARIEENLGYYIEASEHYKCYFNVFPKQIPHRKNFAKILMNLHQYQEAFNQWVLIKKNRQLSNQEIIYYVDCLIHLDQFRKADATIAQLINLYPPLPLEYQLKLAKFLSITHNKSLLDKILAKVPEPAYRSQAENVALLHLWLEIGEYEKAASFIINHRPQLEKSFETLEVISSLQYKLSNFNEVLNFTQMAKKLNPYSTSLDGMINSLQIKEMDLSTLNRRQTVLQKLIQNNSSLITLKIEIIKNLVNIATKKKTLFENKITYNSELHQANSLLNILIEYYPNIPLLYFLLGKIHWLKNDLAKAQDSFELALKLDISYIEPLKGLSAIYLLSNNYEKGWETLNRALKFVPNDPELWIQLAEFYMKENDIPSSIEALKKALQFQPNNQEVYFKLGKLQLILGSPMSENYLGSVPY